MATQAPRPWISDSARWCSETTKSATCTSSSAIPASTTPSSHDGDDLAVAAADAAVAVAAGAPPPGFVPGAGHAMARMPGGSGGGATPDPGCSTPVGSDMAAAESLCCVQMPVSVASLRERLPAMVPWLAPPALPAALRAPHPLLLLLPLPLR
eukprot:359913-Chlamydomonas_euryale.AAC.11